MRPPSDQSARLVDYRLPEASSRDVISEKAGPAPLGVADRASYLSLDVPIEGDPARVAFAFFAWRFSFSDLLAAVFELFEPPLSLLAIVPPREETHVLNVPLLSGPLGAMSVGPR